ncbi:MAG: flagellar biosynthesis protein FlhB [Synergistaceae bacterium]|jgi:flagellar biosynthetic protein FlhB|nr:flagellar biosynthesis protein FlhB [Synergistaceae bacterium]
MTVPFRFDLQFFGEERTEPATPKKRNKTRNEGKVAKSQDLSASVVLITGLLTINSLGGKIWDDLVTLFKESMRYIASPLMPGDGWWFRPAFMAGKSLLYGWLPLGFICALFAVIVLVYQVGFVITTKPFEIKLDRFNPINGLKRIFSLRTMFELAKGMLKASLLLGVLYAALRNERDLMLSIIGFSLSDGVMTIMGKIWDLAMRMAVFLFIIALADYAYQKWEFEKSIKMSKQEIKEEYKQSEGDPLIKRRIRQKQRELARQRMMSDVPKADVVVTNPTHIAVAIQYDQQTMSAPVIVAKGEGFIAQKIKDIAAEHDVPVVENKPLARALMQRVEVGESIPEELYLAVAEVLAFVYRLKKSA